MRRIHCFFSGGKDSAVACALTKRVADVRGWSFRLIHIDTTIYIKETREYVYKYAQWLGAELEIIRPRRTFRELAEKIGMWPSLYPYKMRWCMRELKLKPTMEYLEHNYRSNDLVVLGIRKSESRFREKLYRHIFTQHKYGNRINVLLWMPLLYADDAMVMQLIRRYNVPENPVWRKLGTSGECLCLAGAPVHVIVLIIRHYPEEFKQLLEIDKTISKNRRSTKPSAPFRLAQHNLTLEELYRRINKLDTLDRYIPGKSCEGSCML